MPSPDPLPLLKKVIKTVSLDLNELRELLAAINQTDIAELTLKSEAFELTVRRSLRPGQVAMSEALPPAPLALPEVVSAGSAAIEPAPALSAPPPKTDRRLLEVTSPMVGTFYRAPAPDDAPFVNVGDRIQLGQTVCIIEAMKLMNELETEVSGEIIEILAQNGEPVEYGQVLMRVNPG